MKFQNKMILGIAIIEATFLAALVFFAMRFISVSNHELFENKMQSTLSLLRQSSIDALLTYDIARLESLANDVLNDPMVVQIQISIGESEVVSVGSNLGEINTGLSYYHRDKTITYNDVAIGSFKLIFDGTHIEALVAEYGFYLTIIALVEILFVAGVAWLFSWSLTIDLKKLSKFSRQISGSGPGLQIPPSQSNDELSQLINDFNQMSLRLFDQYHKLELSEQHAHQANKEKDRFLAVISHEIRTPLNGILGLSTVMEAETQGRHQDYCRVINKSGEHLMLILNDILDFSKIEQGKLEIDKKPFVLAHLVNEIHAMYFPLCNDKGLQFVINNSSSPAPLTLVGDEARIKQVIFNLLSNALKFTKTGSISLTFDWHPEPATLDITVTDTGQGIAQDKIALILQPFTQADNTITREFGGTGLGLSIVNQLVKLMAGKLAIDSHVGAGSQFKIALPLKENAQQIHDNSEHITSINQIAWRAKEGSRVLLIDDNKVNLMVAGTLCKKFGLQVDSDTNHLNVLELNRQHEYLFILVDYHMPEISGTELTTLLLKDRPNAIVLGWTADISGETQRAFFHAGAKLVIKKPLNLNNFNSEVIHLVKQLEA